MVTHEHHQVAKAFDKAIDNALLPMRLDTAILTNGQVTIDVNGVSKEADWGWGPRRHPPGCPKRPTVVLEVTISESRANLHRDVNLWLDPASGNTKIVIAVRSSRKLSMITVDKWEWNQNDGHSQISQHIEIWESKSGDEVTVSGPPLTIPPESPRETDLSIGDEEFKEMTKWLWDAHF